MELQGRVSHGVIVPQEPAFLPEGATVRIVYDADHASTKARTGRPVTFPLVESDCPGLMKLTNEMIAELLDRDDLSA